MAASMTTTPSSNGCAPRIKAPSIPLADTEERANGMTVAELADAFDYETRLMEASLDPEHGVELKTIHGAKGLEWPHVIVLGVDEGEMPLIGLPSAIRARPRMRVRLTKASGAWLTSPSPGRGISSPYLPISSRQAHSSLKP